MIELKNVTKTFGGFKALDELTLTVPYGAQVKIEERSVRGYSAAYTLTWRMTVDSALNVLVWGFEMQAQ